MGGRSPPLPTPGQTCRTSRRLLHKNLPEAGGTLPGFPGPPSGGPAYFLQSSYYIPLAEVTFMCANPSSDSYRFFVRAGVTDPDEQRQLYDLLIE